VPRRGLGLSERRRRGPRRSHVSLPNARACARCDSQRRAPRPLRAPRDAPRRHASARRDARARRARLGRARSRRRLPCGPRCDRRRVRWNPRRGLGAVRRESRHPSRVGRPESFPAALRGRPSRRASALRAVPAGVEPHRPRLPIHRARRAGADVDDTDGPRGRHDDAVEDDALPRRVGRWSRSRDGPAVLEERERLPAAVELPAPRLARERVRAPRRAGRVVPRLRLGLALLHPSPRRGPRRGRRGAVAPRDVDRRARRAREPHHEPPLRRAHLRLRDVARPERPERVRRRPERLPSRRRRPRAERDRPRRERDADTRKRGLPLRARDPAPRQPLRPPRRRRARLRHRESRQHDLRQRLRGHLPRPRSRSAASTSATTIRTTPGRSRATISSRTTSSGAPGATTTTRPASSSGSRRER